MTGNGKGKASFLRWWKVTFKQKSEVPKDFSTCICSISGICHKMVEFSTLKGSFNHCTSELLKTTELFLLMKSDAKIQHIKNDAALVKMQKWRVENLPILPLLLSPPFLLLAPRELL